MAFFENLTEALSSKGKEAAEAAKRVAEIANLKSQIGTINVEIKKNYRKIGEAYYDAYKDSEVVCEFEENVQSIRDAKKAVAELEKKIRDLKGDIKCEKCESLIPADSNFCPKCGAKVEPDFFDSEDEDKDEYTEDFIVPEEEGEE
ncbi:MAG: zinc ribbon domain-containing protein [Lachnospiraceae bacterium]|nr:zinc ribbon domain-containing protein [Lachnospiraceae bacterium]MDY5701272.1 zinc ribbon domain-containing protein [Lachnospiraceae bacterium]